MPQSYEISIDLTTQELQELPALDELTEIEDICAVDSLQLPQEVANTEPPLACADMPCVDIEQTMEIELTAMEIDALLEGALKP